MDDRQRLTRAELKRIYKKVDVNRFFSHYKTNTLGQSGDWLRMRCILPGHKDMSASANFNVDKGIYKCFVCGARSFFKLVQELENLSSFYESVEFVKKMVGYGEDNENNQIDLLLEDLKEIQSDDQEEERDPEYVSIDLTKYPEFENAKNHFSKVKKRVSLQMIKQWNLLYAVSGYYKDRLVIPITNENTVMSFAARDMTGRSALWLKMLKQAKKDNLTVTELAELREQYECKKIIYPPILEKKDETKFNIIYGTAIRYLLFNFENAIQCKDYVIVVEGVFDAMALHMWGFNVVALLGTKLSNLNRARLLSNFDRIYVALDNDVNDKGTNPGQEAAIKILESFNNEVEAFNVIMPPNRDPDECSREEFDQLLKQSVIAVENI
jgi:DNA primase